MAVSVNKRFVAQKWQIFNKSTKYVLFGLLGSSLNVVLIIEKLKGFTYESQTNSLNHSTHLTQLWSSINQCNLKVDNTSTFCFCVNNFISATFRNAKPKSMIK